MAKKKEPESTRAARSPEQAKKDKVTVEAINGVATTVMGAIMKDQKPDLAMPVRSLSNVKYDKKSGYFEIGRGKKIRTLTVNTVKTFAQTLKMMSLSKELVENNDFAT